MITDILSIFDIDEKIDKIHNEIMMQYIILWSQEARELRSGYSCEGERESCRRKIKYEQEKIEKLTRERGIIKRRIKREM